MRQSICLLAMVAVVAGALWHENAGAAFYADPRPIEPRTERLRLDAPTLGPMAHAQFCLQYPDDCKVHRMAFRGNSAVSPHRSAAREYASRSMPRSIVASSRNTMTGASQANWLISPARGDCNDYAVTKRHELLERGWPSRALLLAEVVIGSGEYHLVLVVRTEQGDLVADNLSANIRPWYQTRYRWVRVQSPRNPQFWATVAKRVSSS